jgi:hypothetical protein
MSILMYFLIAVAFLGSIYLIFRLLRAFRTYLTFQGNRIVSCPENHCAAAVRVAAAKGAFNAMVGRDHLSLKTCSRWPERHGCGQECLAQIEEAPKACLVWTIINSWYQGQECVYCHKPFGELHWHDHPPALLNREHKTIEWKQIPPEELQEALGKHQPVCWNCHMAETFRREFPEKFVDRPAEWPRMKLYH